MTWAWLLATLACLPLCYRGDSRFLKVCLVLLLGPGALPICSSLHTKDERERAALSLCLLPLTLLAGSSCLLWLLNRALLIDYCEFFQTLSLALPAPAHLLQALNRLVSDPGISLAWLLGNLLLPIWLWRWLCSRHSFAPLASLWLQIDELRRQPGNSVASSLLTDRLLQSWTLILPLSAAPVFFFSMLLGALLLPLTQLVGWIGG